MSVYLTSPSTPLSRPAFGTTASSVKPSPRQSRSDASLFRNTCVASNQGEIKAGGQSLTKPSALHPRLKQQIA